MRTCGVAEGVEKPEIDQLFLRFLTLSPRAEAYYLKLEQHRLNPHHHVRKIVALSDIYGQEAVARAMEDAFAYEAFASDYIANLLEQRCGPQNYRCLLTSGDVSRWSSLLTSPRSKMSGSNSPPTHSSISSCSGCSGSRIASRKLA